MFDYRKEECKDAPPEATIEKIQNILTELSLEVREETIQSTAFTYSTALYLDGDIFVSNGKGVTALLSRASAYAEMLERLQNGVLRMPSSLMSDVVNYGSFRFEPDEQDISLNDVMELNRGCNGAYSFNDKKNSGTPCGDAEDFGLTKWLELEHVDRDTFTGLPYRNLINGQRIILPWQMLLLYGSNGMCAGNTKAEALVQGLSEILERYVNRRIISENITPPDIPMDVLKKYNRSYGVINDFQRNGYQVIVKDCSLNQAFPVLAVIIIHKKQHTYKVKFGSHPRFEIALERCLTEALQGDKLDRVFEKTLLPFKYHHKPPSSAVNIHNSFRIGQSHYAASLFLSKFDYSFTPWPELDSDNTSLLKYLLRMYHSIGCDVYVRDKSYLGFPTLQVLVPGISEAEVSADVYIPPMLMKRAVEKLIFQLPTITAEESDQVIALILSRLNYVTECRTLSDFLSFPVHSKFPHRSESVSFFLAKLFYRKGDVGQAHAIINRFAHELTDEKVLRVTGKSSIYIKCLRDFLDAMQEGAHIKNITSVLIHFYPIDILDQVVADWNVPDLIMQNYEQYPCPNCSVCCWRIHCSRRRFRDLYIKMKDRMASNPIQQDALKEFDLQTTD